jgi:hypothetical protein
MNEAKLNANTLAAATRAKEYSGNLRQPPAQSFSGTNQARFKT